MIWLIPLGFLALYLLAVRLFLKVTPDSISETARLWKQKWAFPLFGMLTGGSTIAIAVTEYDKGGYKDGTSAALMLAGICLFFVGFLLSEYWRKDVEKPHVIYTIVCIIMGMAAITYQLWPNWKAGIPLFAVGALTWLIKKKLKSSHTYYIEIAFATVIYIVLALIKTFMI